MTEDKDSEFYIEKPIAPIKERRARGPYSFANASADIIKRVSPKYGFASADIIINWREIVGEDAARLASPLRIIFPRSEKANGILAIKLKTAAFAPLIQFQFPIIMDRINSYFGFQAVSGVRIDVK